MQRANLPCGTNYSPNGTELCGQKMGAAVARCHRRLCSRFWRCPLEWPSATSDSYTLHHNGSVFRNDQTTVIKCRPGSAELGDLPEQFAFGCPVLRDYRYTPGFNKAQHSVAYAWHCNGATFLIEQDTVIAYLRGIEERREDYCRRAPQDARLVWDIDETAIQTDDVAMSCETL